MFKGSFFIISILLVLLVSKTGYCESVVLKDGRVIVGNIVERTDEYIKMNFQGTTHTFYIEDIERIDASQWIPLPKKVPPQQFFLKGSQGYEADKDIFKSQDSKGYLPGQRGQLPPPPSPLQDSDEDKQEEGLSLDYPSDTTTTLPGVIGGGSYGVPGASGFKTDGISELHWPNGNLMMQIPLKNGKVNGEVKIYDMEGNLSGEMIYKNGELIDQKMIGANKFK